MKRRIRVTALSLFILLAFVLTSMTGQEKKKITPEIAFKTPPLQLTKPLPDISSWIDEKSFVDFEGDSCIIQPNSFALARTVEYFRIPRNVLTICLGKSTYARCGIIVNVTPFEPEWEGYVTLEFSNTTPLPARIYAGEGCAQVLFFESDKDDVCEVSYRDRGGKYQGQVGVTLPKA